MSTCEGIPVSGATGAISARSFAGDTDGPDGWIKVSQLDNTVTLRTVRLAVIGTDLSEKEIVDHYDSPDRLQMEISVTSTEMTSGSPPADIDICDGPDRLQTEISATSTKMTGESSPADIGISKSPDRLQTEISVTSTEMAGGSPPAHIDICEGPDRLQTEISVTLHVNDDMNTDLQEISAPMLRSPTIFKRSCVVSSALPTLNQRIVDPTDVTMDMDTDPPESSAPMITSDLMVVDWEDIICGRPRYGDQDGHDMIDTDSSDHNVRKRMDTADQGYMCRTVVQDQRWSDMDDNSDADSVAELEYKTWEDACALRYRSALVHIPPGLVQNPPRDKIRNYKMNDMSDTDSVAELNYSAWNDACAGDYQNTLGNIRNPPTCKIWNDDMDHSSDTDSVAELEYKTWEDACAWRCRSALVNIPPGWFRIHDGPHTTLRKG